MNKNLINRRKALQWGGASVALLLVPACGDDSKSATAGDMAGTTAGDMAGTTAGDMAGTTAGDMAGTTAGDMAGTTAGDMAGTTAGDMAGMTAGTTGGDMANMPIDLLDDTCCTLVPYFTVQDGKMEEFKALCEEFMEATQTEEDVLYYGFSFNGNKAHCREAYKGANGILAHLTNVGPIFERALEIATLDLLEVHGIEAELDLLREPLADLMPAYWTLEYGFRRDTPNSTPDEDSLCTLVPYFTVQDGKMEEFKALCDQFLPKTDMEEGVLFYGFSFNGNKAHCREGYKNAAGVLAHLTNVGDLLGQALEIASLDKLEVHGPASELDQLREPLADLTPDYWTLEYGFRR